jgi:uncharacterized protein
VRGADQDLPVSQDLGVVKGTLRFDSLHQGANPVALELTAEELELEAGEYRFPVPVVLSLTVYRALETFTLSGAVRWQVAGECYRCLAPASQELEVPLQLVIQRRQTSAEEQRAVADDGEVALCDPGAPVFDLRPLVRETVLVESPVRVSCREDCKGLCPHCGGDLNQGACSCTAEPVDSRWAALKDVRFH